MRKSFTVDCRKTGLFGREERHFLYFNHLSKEFPKQMIPYLKAPTQGYQNQEKNWGWYHPEDGQAPLTKKAPFSLKLVWSLSCQRFFKFQKILEKCRKFQKNLENLRKIQKILENLENLRKIQKILEKSRKFQKNLENFRKIQKNLKNFRKFQKNLENFRKIQKIL